MRRIVVVGCVGIDSYVIIHVCSAVTIQCHKPPPYYTCVPITVMLQGAARVRCLEDLICLLGSAHMPRGLLLSLLRCEQVTKTMIATYWIATKLIIKADTDGFMHVINHNVCVWGHYACEHLCMCVSIPVG